ncbi:MAG: GNAT family N-acetyltransferase [Deltaproteobacteria bacterium]|nr:GNAT family N-acetyltransferase [Deltaproteobacteria bacterium]
MEKICKLVDGTEVTIRSATENDVDKSFAFFQALSSDEKAYLRVDVTDHNVVAQRLGNKGLQKAKRLVALVDDQIIADGAIELNSAGWEAHIAELRLLVSDTAQRKGLGMAMAEELYLVAAKGKVEEIIVKLMVPQTEARKIFSRLGFQEEVVLKNYVKDVRGMKQDLLIMRCNLDALWKELEGAFNEAEKLETH